MRKNGKKMDGFGLNPPIHGRFLTHQKSGFKLKCG
jgi:hypothetical protein